MYVEDKHVERYPTSCVIGKCKLKNEDAITQVSQWPKYNTLTHQILAKMWSKRNLFIADGKTKWYSYCGRHFSNFL
jgi:hypothetical protein